jgi:hypothetical protein
LQVFREELIDKTCFRTIIGREPKMSTREPLSNLANVLSYFKREIDEIRVEVCSRNGWTQGQWDDFLAVYCREFLINRGDLVIENGKWTLKDNGEKRNS